MRAAIYSRFSTDKQSSIADQNRVCAEWCQRNHVTVFARFEDRGISGAAVGNRPSLQAALAAPVDMLVVMELTRLSRSQADLPKMIDRLVHRGVRVVGVQDGYDTARKGHKFQLGITGMFGESFRETIAEKTHAAHESRAREGKATGGRAFGYSSVGEIVEKESEIVREIYSRFGAGESYRMIAASLNARNVPSPGSSWKRKQRRCSGWMGSAIRVILFNERYRGVIRWNTSDWRKDPDSGRRQRVMRPSSEWITYLDENRRIVSEALWERARRRLRAGADNPRIKSGGKPKFLLSGLLVCDKCGGHYILDSAVAYRCASFRDGNACNNDVRVRRDRAEQILVDPIRNELLSPARIALMAKEMQSYYAEQVRAMRSRTTDAPRELEELNARIERLRERLRKGDPDMTFDELQAAIDRAEGKRRELSEQVGNTVPSAKLFAMLPRAAELYREQITLGLDGDPKAAVTARAFLREWFGGEIRLVPEPDGGLVAHWKLDTGALLRAVVTDGSGGRICHVRGGRFCSS